MRIHKTWEILGEDLQDFGREFVRFWETLGRGFTMICEDWQDFGIFWRGFMRIWETLGEDFQGFMRIWKTLGENL